jgi:hypothetical protein
MCTLQATGAGTPFPDRLCFHPRGRLDAPVYKDRLGVEEASLSYIFDGADRMLPALEGIRGGIWSDVEF